MSDELPENCSCAKTIRALEACVKDWMAAAPPGGMLRILGNSKSTVLDCIRQAYREGLLAGACGGNAVTDIRRCPVHDPPKAVSYKSCRDELQHDCRAYLEEHKEQMTEAERIAWAGLAGLVNKPNS
ncbi:MAG: hypothetical protein AB7T38_02530 [Nitrospirales bacterium]